MFYGCTKNSVSKPELLLPIVDIDKNSNTITLTSSVKSEGSAATNERGFCLSKSPNPSVSDIKISVGYGPGEFKYLVSNLDLGTTYYLKSYATNSVGTSYSNEVSFNTLNGVKFSESKFEIFNGSLFGIDVNINYSISDFGDGVIKNIGLIYSYNPNVTYKTDSTNIKYKNTNDKTGVIKLVNLQIGKKVFYKIYVESGAGIFLSNEQSFVNPDYPVIGKSKISSLPNNLYYLETEILSTGGYDIIYGGYLFYPITNPASQEFVNTPTVSNSKIYFTFSNLKSKTTYRFRPIISSKWVASQLDENLDFTFTTN